MSGIARDSINTFRRKVETFSSSYVGDWNAWLATSASARPAQIGRILRKWQACRPNRMRRDAQSATHAAPYLDDLLIRAAPHIKALSTFDIAHPAALETVTHTAALDQLWDVFEELSYHGQVRQGRAGSVGISKAVMLMTDGRVGPAFDKSVRTALGLGEITHRAQWREALSVVNTDIQEFERATGTRFSEAKPSTFTGLHNGRIYDMALGPR